MAGMRGLKKSDMKLVGIGAEDLVGGNKTLVLGLTWTLILRYEIHKFDTTHQELLNWVRSVGSLRRCSPSRKRRTASMHSYPT